MFGILYFLLDHPSYFYKTGFFKNWAPETKAKLEWYCEMCWLLETFFSLMCHVVELQDMKARLDNLVQIRAQVTAQKQSLVNSAMDAETQEAKRQRIGA